MEPLLLLRLQSLASTIQPEDMKSLHTMKTWLLAESNPDTMPFEIMERFVFIETSMLAHERVSKTGISRQCRDLASAQSLDVQRYVHYILLRFHGETILSYEDYSCSDEAKQLPLYA